MMRSPAKRFSLLALLALVVLIPACSKDEPPAPAPQPVPPPAPQPAPRREVAPPEAGEWEVADAGEEESFLSAEQINARQLLRTIHFDYDSAEIRGDQRATLQANADWLREHPNVRILIREELDKFRCNSANTQPAECFNSSLPHIPILIYQELDES